MQDLSAILQQRGSILAQASPSAMLISRASDDVILFANDRVAAVFGLTAQEIIGHKTAEFYQDSTAHQTLMQRLAQGEQIADCEVLAQKAAGAPFWALVSLQSVVAQEQAAVLSGFYDITSHKQTEEALRASEERYRALFENNPSMYFTVSAEGLVLSVNRFGAEQLGYAPTDLIGQSVLGVFYEEDKPEVLRQLRHCVQHPDRVHEWEFRKVRRDGSVLWVKEAARAMREAGGQVLVLIVCEDITYRKRTEQEIRQLNQALEQRVVARTAELHESEEKFRQLAENIDAVFWMNSPSANELVYISPAYEKIWGRPTSHLEEKPRAFVDDLLPEDKPLMLALLAKQERGEPYEGEYRIVRPDGEVRWIHDRGFPIINERGEVYRFAGIAQDVTPRKQMEQHLQENERFFRGAFDHAPIGMAIVKADGRFIKVNEACSEILGYSQQELLQLTFQSVTHPEDLATNLNLMRASIAQGLERYHLQKRYIHKLGHAVWTDLSVSIVRDGEGTPLYLVAKILDITESRRAEEALRASEERYRTLAESAQDFVYIISRTGEIQYLNHFAAAFFQKKPVDVIGKHFSQMFSPAENARLWRRVQELLDSGEPIYRETQVQFPDQTLWVDNRLVPLRDREQNVYAVLGISRDITARKQMEAELRQYATGLETLVDERTRQMRELERQRIENEKLAATGRMAARIAHEINNPLGFLQVAFQLISRDVDPQSKHRHYLAKIEKEIERIALIIRQMLDVHRPQQEKPQAFRPTETIHDVLMMMRPHTQARGVLFDLDLTRAQQSLVLPENMLRQVLYNVILNAVEASLPNENVKIFAQATTQQLAITISDHGPGIPEEVQARMFEPFFTTKAATKHSGMGLGLSICKSLVETMNGAIKITSQPGAGTTCEIILPVEN